MKRCNEEDGGNECVLTMINQGRMKHYYGIINVGIEMEAVMEVDGRG